MKRWHILGVGALAFGLLGTRLAAAPPPRVGEVVNISADELTDNEVSLAVNPTNPLNLLAGWNDWEEQQGVGYSYSLDGGRTWSPPALIPGVVGSEGSFQLAGDPAFHFGPDGTAYAVVQAFNITAPFEAALMVAVSSDGGRSWPRLLVGYRGHREERDRPAHRHVPDRAAVTTDSHPASPYFGTVYVAWGQEQETTETPSVLLTYLRPGADKFSPPTEVTNWPAGFTQNAVPFTAPGGTVYVTFVAEEPGAASSGIYLAESRDGGRSFDEPRRVALFQDPVAGRLPNTSYRVVSFPVGLFAPAPNRLVVVWNDQRDGVSTVLVSTASPVETDRWSEPAQVTATSTGEQFFPAIAASPDGRLDLVFYDRSRDPGNRLNFATYAWSGDGGESWESLNVTDIPFDGERQTTPGGTAFIGDYIGVASTTAATHIAWTGNGPETPCSCNQDIFTLAVSHTSSEESGAQ